MLDFFSNRCCCVSLCLRRGAPLLGLLVIACMGDDATLLPKGAAPSVPDWADGELSGQEPPATERPRSTHSALLSIQEQSIAGRPELGHGTSVRLDFNQATRAPDFDESPGELSGCKAWLYRMQGDPPPLPSGDEGRVVIQGTDESIPACVHGPSGYYCPVGEWPLQQARVLPSGNGVAHYEIPAGTFSEELASGRYVWLDGNVPSAAGRFPILGVASTTSLVVHNPSAVEATLEAGTATILAGAGPVPNNPRNPIRGGEQVSVQIEPRAGGHFSFAPALLIAGSDFAPDAATLELLQRFPLDAIAPKLSCDGVGGRCGEAELSALSIVTTDAELTGVSPFALPPAARNQVFVSCGVLGGDGSIPLPSGVMDLLREAHAQSPITRLRVAYMQDGFAAAQNAAPEPPNPVSILIGHQVLGFTTFEP